MAQIPQKVDGQEVLNNALAGHPVPHADNQPANNNQGNEAAADSVVSAHLLDSLFHFIPKIVNI